MFLCWSRVLNHLFQVGIRYLLLPLYLRETSTFWWIESWHSELDIARYSTLCAGRAMVQNMTRGNPSPILLTHRNLYGISKQLELRGSSALGGYLLSGIVVRDPIGFGGSGLSKSTHLFLIHDVILSIILSSPHLVRLPRLFFSSPTQPHQIASPTIVLVYT